MGKKTFFRPLASEEPEVEESKEVETSKPQAASTYTGKEHWGEGGRFKVLPNGLRVRVKEKE